MKIIINVLLFFLININLYSIEGKWTFNNMFSQRIENGSATINNLDIGIIKSIFFENIKYNRNDNSNYPLMKGKIEILSTDDIYKLYDCLYMDMGSSIIIIVEQGIKIKISIFISNISNIKNWYSYAISADIQYGIIKGTEINDLIFMNMIGIMERIN